MVVIPTGLGAVAAYATEAGHDVRLLDLLSKANPAATIENAISEFNPQVIGISVRNIDDQSMDAPNFMLEKIKGVVEHCRRVSRSPIVLGGAGYSIFPDASLSYLGADMGIQGDGELAFIALIERIEKGSALSDVPGLHLTGRGRQKEPAFGPDLDALPLPDPKIWESYRCAAEETWMPFQTRRGCPMDCSYCSTYLIEGRAIRKRSLDKVVEGLAACASAGFKRIHFTDDTFNLPYSYARDLCRLIIERGLDIQWRCILYPKHIDETLVKLIAEAGCVEAAIGSESGDANILRNLNKKFGLDEVRGISEMLGAYSVKREGFLLLGGPGETTESVARSLEFVDSLNLELIFVTVGIRIYPYTALARTAVNEGVISHGDNLLLPKFYLARGLEGWLQETVKKWASTRPNWIA